MKAKFGSFAELTHDKNVVPVISSGRFDISKEFFSALIDVALGTTGFDEKWYQVHYPDIRKGLDEKIIKTARWHYSHFGYFEHRLPRLIEVDAEFYGSAYQDIGLAIKEGRIKSAQWHFENFGFREGRTPREGFALFPAVAG